MHVAQTYGGLRPVLRSVRGGLALWQLRRAKELLSANLDGASTLEEIAQECRLSVSHFSRGFRQTVGVAPHKWLQSFRIDSAKNLLRKQEKTLSDVALACGFADQSHFTRVFTRMTGISPGAWRRGLEQGEVSWTGPHEFQTGSAVLHEPSGRCRKMLFCALRSLQPAFSRACSHANGRPPSVWRDYRR